MNIFKIFTLKWFEDAKRAPITGLISFYITIVSLGLTLVFFYTSYYHPYSVSIEDKEKELSSLHSTGNWISLEKEVNKIEEDTKFKDIYYLYKGITIEQITHLPKENPDFYYDKVNSESPYYEKALKERISFYYRTYKGKDLSTNLNNLLGELESNHFTYSPYYYFLRLSTLENYNLNSVTPLYQEFLNTYKEYDPYSRKFNVKTTSVGEVNINNSAAVNIQALDSLFISELSRLSRTENRDSYFTKYKVLEEGLIGNGLESFSANIQHFIYMTIQTNTDYETNWSNIEEMIHGELFGKSTRET
ncbi:hypothetical protein B9G55_16890 [Saccharibacillus sp. O16]|nr:hypothetical protein B9G55_16890 [Saccharibacillus sp. O16]